MYGKTAVDFPQRIVCLTAETAEIAFTLGAGDRVIGVPGTARRPEAAREKARAGGHDVFAELRQHGGARERVVTPDEVARRDPQIILASWCGKPVDRAAVAARPGWSSVSAVSAGQIHEIPGEDVLVPGPSLVHG